MSKQKHRSKAEWRNLIEQHARNGLNGVAFCSQQGLSRITFYRHRKALEEKMFYSQTDQFIKVQPKAVSMMRAQPAAVLHYRDSRLHLFKSADDAAWVAELMKALV